MAVQARFYVESILKRAYDPVQVDVTLKAAGRGEQNKAWAKYTPSGDITMHVNNPAAAAWFEERLGRDIALTFDDIPDDDTRHTSPHGE